MWTYIQRRGTLFHDGVLVGTGYAGGNIPPAFDASAVNNPAREREHNFGPLPCGEYQIGPAHTEPRLGPIAMRLFPHDDNLMWGRSGFFIHADSIAHPGKASEGCIVMGEAVRLALKASNDRTLTVIAGE